MEAAKSNKLLFGLALLLGGLYLLWPSNKTEDKQASASNPSTPEPSTTATTTTITTEPQTELVPEMTQEEANALAAKLVVGRMAVANRKQNKEILEELMAGGYEPKCLTSGADGYSCVAIKTTN